MSAHDLPLRLGFIGGFGHHYLRGALSDPDLTIEALAVAGDGREPDAARGKFKDLLDRATWFDDPVAMFDAFRPTVVSIGGVYAHNSGIIVEALRRGVAVVADKPIAATWKALDALREAASDGNKALLTEFDFRSRATFRAARAAVEAGEIGDVVLATAQKSYRFGEPGSRPDFYRRREDYGSTMLWIASHGIDAIRFTTGLRFRTVAGAHGNLSKPDYAAMEDHCAALFTMERGATGVVHADYLRPAAADTHGDDRLRIAGGRGVIEIRGDRCLITTHDRPERDATDSATPAPMHRELLDAALRGDTRWYGTEASLETATALLAARDAADTGRVVTW